MVPRCFVERSAGSKQASRTSPQPENLSKRGNPHTLTVWSRLAVARVCQFGANATPRTSRVWLRRVLKCKAKVRVC